MAPPDADVVVIGGGLAGTAAAAAARHAGREVLWLDDGGPRASDTPVALIHPFAGGSFRPRPHAAEAWRVALRWFGQEVGTGGGEGVAHHRSGSDQVPGPVPPMASTASAVCVHRAVLRRHAAPGPRGQRLRNSWPHAVALARDLFSQVMSSSEGSWFEYGPVMGVDLSLALNRRRDALRASGVVVQPSRAEALCDAGGLWGVETGGGLIRARSVVLAAGAGSVSLLAPFMPTAALMRAEGVLAHAPTTTAGERFIVSGGHVSQSPSRVAWGATYRMLDAKRPDLREHDAELRTIDARLRAAGAAMPALAEAQRWTGVRLVDARTREPWVCQPRAGLHVFTAFGSQGGLWIPWHARRLGQALAAPGTDLR